MEPSNLEGNSSVSSPEEEATNLDAENQTDATSIEDQEATSESSAGVDEKETVPEEDWNPLDVVKAAIKETKDAEGGADEDQSKQEDESSLSESDSQKKEDEESGELGEVTEEELKSYKPQTRKRIESLLDDRQRLNERVGLLEPQAEQMETLQTFMKDKSLSAQDVSQYMVLGSLGKSDDPADLRAALDQINIYKTALEGQLGEVLPEDLQTRVDEGLLDAEGAKEVALSRVNTERAGRQAEAAQNTAQTVEQQTTQNAEASAAAVINTTMSDWQHQKMATDPDFATKAPFLEDKIRSKVAAAGGRVLDQSQALKIAEEAYSEVQAQVKAIAPAKVPEAKKVLKSGGAPGNLTSQPKTAHDAVLQALAKTSG